MGVWKHSVNLIKIKVVKNVYDSEPVYAYM